MRNSAAYLLPFVLFAGCAPHTVAAMPTDIGGIAPLVIQKQPLPYPSWAVVAVPGSHDHSGPYPSQIVSDGHETMWTSLISQKEIASITMGQNVATYPVNLNPAALVVGPDHNVWVTGYDPFVERVTPMGIKTDFPIGQQEETGKSIIVGPDGALWFDILVGGGSSIMGRMTTDGTFDSISFSTHTVVEGLTVGPDGNIWVADFLGAIHSFSTSGVDTVYPVRNSPLSIAPGPDGALWFTETKRTTSDPGPLGRITTSGSVKYFKPPSGYTLWQIIPGTDGYMWIVYTIDNDFGGFIGFDTHTNTWGAPILFPHYAMRSGFLAEGPDRNLWMTAGIEEVGTYVRLAMTVSPSSLTIAAPGDTGTLTTAETDYHGAWTGTTSSKSIATVGQTSSGVFTVTGVSAGSCTITISDTTHNFVHVGVVVQ